MSDATERLIGQLVADAGPVRRLRPPTVRALLWLLVVAAAAAAAILMFADLDVFVRRAQDPSLAAELAGTLLTGVAAVVAAFHLSLPDRSRAWLLAPIPPLILWIASSGYGCWRHWIAHGPYGWELGDSATCLRFILAASVPLGASLLLILRRARPLAPASVAAVGGLGVAGVAAFVLQFFHPFDVTFIDLGVHLAAVGLVVAASSMIGFFSGERRGA